MIADAVLGKKHIKPTSIDKIKEAVKTSIGDKVAETYIQPIFDNINNAFTDWNNAGSTKTTLLKEKLRERLKQYGVFKFSESILDEFIDIFMSRTINVYCRPLESKDDPLYKEFLDMIVNQVSNTLQRCLNDEPIWGLYLDEKQPDGTMRTYLAVIFIQVNEFIWIPATPDKAELENGEELKRADFSKMFNPLYEMLFPTKQSRGLVRVNGPRGGEHLCGEIFSPRKREDHTEEQKKIKLNNDYSMEIFVKAKK